MPLPLPTDSVTQLGICSWKIAEWEMALNCTVDGLMLMESYMYPAHWWPPVLLLTDSSNFLSREIQLLFIEEGVLSLPAELNWGSISVHWRKSSLTMSSANQIICSWELTDKWTELFIERFSRWLSHKITESIVHTQPSYMQRKLRCCFTYNRTFIYLIKNWCVSRKII